MCAGLGACDKDLSVLRPSLAVGHAFWLIFALAACAGAGATPVGMSLCR